MIFALALLLATRNLSDAVTDFSLFGGFRVNLGAVLGVAAIGYAAVLVFILGRRALVITAIVVSAGLAIWLMVGFVNYGPNATMFREWMRLLSIVAVMVVAANIPHLTPRIAALIVVAALIPSMIVADAQLLLNLSNIGPEQTRDFFRVTGTFVQANKAAQAFVVLLFLTVWLAYLRWTWVAAAIAIGAGAALLGTRSMGGLGATAVAAIALALLHRIGSRRTRITILVTAVLLVALFVISPFGASRIEALAETRLPWDVTGRTANSLEWRMYNWWLLTAEWAERPVLGHGLGATLQEILPVDRVTHSDPVRILVEGGIVGVGLIAFAIVLVVRGAARAITEAGIGETALLTRIVLAVAIGLAAQTFVQNTLSNTALMYSIVVLLVAILKPLNDLRTDTTVA